MAFTELEKAYVAGFFDGEGCVGIYDHGAGPWLLVVITQKDPSTLSWLHEAYGGSLSAAGPAWSWRVYASRAAVFLSDMLPYLRTKHEQAQIAVDFQQRKNLRPPSRRPRTVKEKAYEAACATKLRRLKR